LTKPRQEVEEKVVVAVPAFLERDVAECLFIGRASGSTFDEDMQVLSPGSASVSAAPDAVSRRTASVA
jgi:hypothetical protein